MASWAIDIDAVNAGRAKVPFTRRIKPLDQVLGFHRTNNHDVEFSWSSTVVGVEVDGRAEGQPPAVMFLSLTEEVPLEHPASLADFAYSLSLADLPFQFLSQKIVEFLVGLLWVLPSNTVLAKP